ncbi:hypothetical protein ACFY1P_24020 [Streptomyces sp. NPDC001407]|uniref:hypothetical protein n=1 Tax=unclassified Streptomyces TaxID=2593676 RepID=UPI0033EC096B
MKRTSVVLVLAASVLAAAPAAHADDPVSRLAKLGSASKKLPVDNGIHKIKGVGEALASHIEEGRLVPDSEASLRLGRH